MTYKGYRIPVAGAIAALCLGIALVAIAYYRSNAVDPSVLHQILLMDTQGIAHPLKVEVASTPDAQQLGLMYRTSVPYGMLFSFDQSRVLTFWMKNTLVPLDILFFREDMSYLSRTTMETCLKQPSCPSYNSPAPAQYALEMPAGFAARLGVGTGWLLVIRQP